MFSNLSRVHRMIVVSALTLSFQAGCGFPEAQFDLAPTSRLPKWFEPPSGVPRTDVTVTMAYYLVPEGKGSAVFQMLTIDGRKIGEVTAVRSGGEPITVRNGRRVDGAGGDRYPMYEVLTVKGITEIIEHRRREPFFYITDDAEVRTAVGLQK